MRKYPVRDTLRAWDHVLVLDRASGGISTVSYSNFVKNPENKWVAKGDPGAAGPQGPAGPEGNQGPEGPQGPRGLQGAQGVQGVQGIQGARGDPGTSDQQVFIQNTQPADTGTPYLWIQTGLAGGGFTFWFNDTGTT